MALLLKNGLVVMERGGQLTVSRADLLVRGQRIAAIGSDAAAALPHEDLDVVDATDRLILPGLVNCHTHPLSSLERGLSRPAPLDIWILYALALRGAPPTPRESYVASLVDAIEKAKTGTTASLSHLFAGYFPSEEILDAHFAACRDAGVRTTVAPVYADVGGVGLPWADEVIPSEFRRSVRSLSAADYEERFAVFDRVFERWHGAADGRLRFGLGPTSPHRCTDELLERTAEWAARRAVIVHLHLLEAFTWVVTARHQHQEHGCSTVRRLSALGLLNPRTSLAHGVWLSEEEAELVAQQNAWIVHNPIANLYLADGIAPIARYRQAGVRVALGTDSCTTAGNVNLLVQLHLAAVLQWMANPLAGPPDWLDEHQVLQMATRGGAGVLQSEEELGAVEVGRKADLVLLDTSDFPFVPLNDPLNQLVYGGGRARIDMVLVDGRVIVRDGRMTTVNEAEVYAEANEIAVRLREQLPDSLKSAERLAPYVAEICRRAYAELDETHPARPSPRVNLQW